MATLFDFESIKNRLIQSLQSKEQWKEFLRISTNNSIIDPFAEEEARLAHYVEYLTRENKWDLAQNKSSLTSQATINAYIPKRKIGALGTLKVSASENFDTPPTVNISLPKNTRFTNGTYTYSTLSENVITTSDNFIEVSVIQSIPQSISFTAQGLNFEEFFINNDSVENNIFSTYVNDILWSNLDDIREAEDSEEAYQIVNELDFSGLSLRFGNNLNGKKLTLGDSVRFEFYETEGSDGNILTANQITEVEDTITDNNGDLAEIFVTNEDIIVGGADIENTEEIRAKAPQIGQSANSATTNNSYKALIEEIPFVSRAVVWGAIEYNLDQGLPYSAFIPSEENRIRISAFTDSGDQLSEPQQDLIIASILNRKAPTDIPLFVEVGFLKLRFNITAYSANKNQTLSSFKSNIESFISSEYSLFNFDFKQSLHESDYKSAIDDTDNIPGMGHHNTEVKVILDGVFNSAYQASFNLQMYPIATTTIEIWVRDNTVGTPVFVKIGVDNGLGGFTAEPGYDLTGSSINYANGQGSLIVVSGLSETFSDYDIKYYHGQNNIDPNSGLRVEDLIPNLRNEIFKYSESNIFVEYEV